MSKNLITVARSVAERDTANAVDRATVIIERVEIYFHNDTYGADSENPEFDEWRPLYPYDNDEVSLIAVVWAKSEGDEEFKPYSGEGFKNDGRYYCLHENRPAPNMNFIPQDQREKNKDDRMPDEIAEVEAWPWTGIDMQFEWQRLDFKGSGSLDDGRDFEYQAPKLVRMTTFPEGMEDSPDAIATEELLHDWDLPLPPGHGTTRYRVVIGLDEQVKLTKKTLRADQEGTLKLCDEFEQKITSRRKERTNGRNGYADKGQCLRLSRRMSEIPLCREGTKEMLRWATAYINTAYDNGGHWFGGRAKLDEDQKDTKVYGGHGVDCNGFICGAAQMGELAPFHRLTFEEYQAKHADSKKSEEKLKESWASARRKWRFAPMGRKLRSYPGTLVSSDDLMPGDMLDYKKHSHVALVWDISADGKIWIIDSSGSQQGVSIHGGPARRNGIESECELVDLTRPEPRSHK